MARSLLPSRRLASRMASIASTSTGTGPAIRAMPSANSVVAAANSSSNRLRRLATSSSTTLSSAWAKVRFRFTR